MKAILYGWFAALLGLTGLGAWATYSDYLIDEAEQFTYDLKEDSVSRRRPKFFDSYFKKRGPLGGGFGSGK